MRNHLLMIEDDARLAAMVAEYLTQNGFTVSHAADAKTGLAHLSAVGSSPAPDLVVLDLASTPAIEQATRRAADIWQALFPTIMLGDDRAVRAVWVGGRRLKG